MAEKLPFAEVYSECGGSGGGGGGGGGGERGFLTRREGVTLRRVGVDSKRRRERNTKSPCGEADSRSEHPCNHIVFATSVMQCVLHMCHVSYLMQT